MCSKGYASVAISLIERTRSAIWVRFLERSLLWFFRHHAIVLHNKLKRPKIFLALVRTSKSQHFRRISNREVRRERCQHRSQSILTQFVREIRAVQQFYQIIVAFNKSKEAIVIVLNDEISQLQYLFDLRMVSFLLHQLGKNNHLYCEWKQRDLWSTHLIRKIVKQRQ